MNTVQRYMEAPLAAELSVDLHTALGVGGVARASALRSEYRSTSGRGLGLPLSPRFARRR